MTVPKNLMEPSIVSHTQARHGLYKKKSANSSIMIVEAPLICMAAGMHAYIILFMNAYSILVLKIHCTKIF